MTIGPRLGRSGYSTRPNAAVRARSLGVSATLAGEVKRSLTVFNAGSETPVENLFVASDGDETALCARLQEILGVPVHFLDSFLPGDAVQVDKARRGRFTAAIGLVQRWAEKPELGINFVCPKEPKQAANPRTRQKVLAAVLGGILFLFLVVFGNIVLAGKRDQIQELNQRKTEVETSLKSIWPRRSRTSTPSRTGTTPPSRGSTSSMT